jgi:hypothetical protein
MPREMTHQRPPGRAEAMTLLRTRNALLLPGGNAYV